MRTCFFYISVGLSDTTEYVKPFNAGYVWFNTSDNLVIADTSITAQNTYTGGAYQQATSVVTQTNQGCYELTDGCKSVYGIEVRVMPYGSSD